MRQLLVIAALAAILGAAAPAIAQPAAAPTVETAAAISIDEARRLFVEAQALARSGKVADIAPKAVQLDRALSMPDTRATIDGAPIMLFDGDYERRTMEAWLRTPEGQPLARQSPRLVDDPYPKIAFLLGVYYNEVGRPAQAARVLGAGANSLRRHRDRTLSESMPYLLTETAATLGQEKRWDDVYRLHTMGLTLPAVAPGQRAVMYRGQGFALIELGRLDEAEAAIKASLELEPDSARSKVELDYIAQLRKGGSKQGMEMYMSPPAAPAAPAK